MIGERIRHARLLAGLTLEEVAAQMAAHKQPITKAGLSKYENNKSTPKPDFLVLLAHLLRVKSSYFWQDTTVQVEWIAYRKHAQLSVARKDQIKALAIKYAESYIWLQSSLNKGEKPNFLKAQPVRDFVDAERVAEKVRQAWKLDMVPIENMMQTIEDQGGIAVAFPAKGVKFDGLAGWVNDRYPLVVSNSAISNDRFRYNLAHELGHIVIDPSKKSDKDVERYAHRFATAFLVPAEAAYKELGHKRRSLGLGELQLLKRKYGMSMQAWVRRAYDLGIIDEGQYKRQCITFSAQGMRKMEPGDREVSEEPQKIKLMTHRALAEGMITRDKAEELCPGCVEELEQKRVMTPRSKMKTTRSAIDLIKLPKEERNKILLVAAKKAEKEYRSNTTLTSFEAYAEDDLHDETK